MDQSAFGLKTVLRMSAVLLVILGLGIFLVVVLDGTKDISRFIYFTVDFPGFAVVFCVSLLALVPVLNREAARWISEWPIGKLSPILIAFVALIVSLLSVEAVYHSYPFSMDEWMTHLQAEIFLSGQVSATVPEEWRPYGRAMYHGFASFDAQSGTIASNYRPGMAALYAGFSLIGLGPYTSAILNGIAILLVARVAHQLFPKHPEAPVVAALLLATSQQAFAASLTSYAMTAHLCLNLAWLTLFLEDRWKSHMAAALIGVLTAALHQVHLHLFFAAPFLLTLLRPLRPGLIVMYISTYVVGHLAVLGWDWLSFSRFVLPAENVQPTMQQGDVPSLFERVGQMFSFPQIEDIATVLANLVRMLAWQSLALLPLILFGWRTIRDHRFLPLLGWSITISLLPYIFLMPDQGHGWGYRYLHGLLGNLALLAVPGWILLRKLKAGNMFFGWIVICLIGTPFLLMPFRAFQIEQMVGPYAKGTALAAAQDSDIVFMNSRQVWIGGDLLRNSAVSLQMPIQMNEHDLTPDQIKELCRRYSVVVLDLEQYKAAGLRVAEDVDRSANRDFEDRQRALAECGA